MKHSIATVSLSGTLPEKLRAIAGVGFDGGPADVRKMCKDLGLEIMLFQLFRDFEGVRVGVWRNNWNEPSANLI